MKPLGHSGSCHRSATDKPAAIRTKPKAGLQAPQRQASVQVGFSSQRH
jgi:hypothetical protein